ncbi:MAG: rhomboid family intramembrane serine protease [Deltaproteobacteria bacterium]|nr:rhomboid family intramembrane serine protease [Deltaproteobacteria bacterium]
MFPLKDENPTYHKSFATFTIIGLNVLAWIFVQGVGFNPHLAISVCKYGLIPGELFGKISPGTQVPMGAGLACVVGNDPKLMTLITSMFMHGGWLHIIGNMWFLAVFGDNVEDVLGPVRFIFFYLLCGLSAAAAQMIANPASPVPMVGASGAIGGVMGAYALIFPRAPVHMLIFFGFFFTRVVVPAVFILGYWFFLQLLGGLVSSGGSGGVAFWAHIGGFSAGIVLIKILCNKRRLSECRLRKGRTNSILRRVK